MSPSIHRKILPEIIKSLNIAKRNWEQRNYSLKKINCSSKLPKTGVCYFQCDNKKIIAGFKDNTIKIFNRSDFTCITTLIGHTGSVKCLQYNDDIIVSGSNDSTLRIWDISTGILVTCSKDLTVFVYDMKSPTEISVCGMLIGHDDEINAVDFNGKYIVSAGNDATIKIWNTSSCEFIRNLNGHTDGIKSLQCQDNLVISGSSDNSIRLWDIAEAVCLRVLEGHKSPVQCVRFNSKRIISGSCDGEIKLWDFTAAVHNPKSNTNSLCLHTFTKHTECISCLQFDEFQIVSSSDDGTIFIWEFLLFDYFSQEIKNLKIVD